MTVYDLPRDLVLESKIETQANQLKKTLLNLNIISFGNLCEDFIVW